MSEDKYQQYRQAFEEFTEKFDVPTADMLEIVAGGGNGVELVDLPGLLERAAKGLREKQTEIKRLQKDLQMVSKDNPFKTDADKLKEKDEQIEKLKEQNRTFECTIREFLRGAAEKSERLGAEPPTKGCRVCGLQLTDSLGRLVAMGYSCRRDDCPSRVIC